MDKFDFGLLQQQKMKKKSSSTKKGSYVSFVNRGGAYTDESALELIRLSLKKEGDRHDRLQKLLKKYQSIRNAQKEYIKAIKASIIELKDIPTVPKIKFLVDPNIYVDNNLSIQTRQFLCVLLNTFYKRYQQNQDYQKRSHEMSENIRFLIRSVSHNEQMLFKAQRLSINHQVQTESQLLTEKGKIKQQNQKIKQAQAEQKRIRVIWLEHKSHYQQQKEKLESLKKCADQLQYKLTSLNDKINHGQEIRQGNQEKITGELTYQRKFEEQVSLLKAQITNQFNRENRLKKKIMQKKMKIDKMNNLVNVDNKKHEILMKILDLQHPGPSQQCLGVGELRNGQQSYTITMKN